MAPVLLMNIKGVKNVQEKYIVFYTIGKLYIMLCIFCTQKFIDFTTLKFIFCKFAIFMNIYKIIITKEIEKI